VRWRRLVWFAAVGVALAVGVVFSRSLRPELGVPEGLVAVSGRLEGDAVKISGKQPGRIARLLAREGDTVRAGQLLVELEDETLRGRNASALAALAVAERRADAAHAALDVARRALPLELRAARAGLHSAHAAVEQAELTATQATRDDERGRSLFDRGVINQQQAETLTLHKDVTSSETTAARSAQRRAVIALDQARLGEARLRASEADAAVLDAAVEQARAAAAEITSALAELSIKAPVSGTLTGRFVNVGEVVGAGTPLLEVVDLDALYLRAYVPEPEVGRVHLGCEARIYTDSDPEHPVSAELRYIAARAEFTPKEVQTADERVKLVYAVKLYLTENPEHRLTPGQSADAVIRWQDGVAWSKPGL
jgi:HlyD family secretion protein